MIAWVQPSATWSPAASAAASTAWPRAWISASVPSPPTHQAWSWKSCQARVISLPRRPGRWPGTRPGARGRRWPLHVQTNTSVHADPSVSGTGPRSAQIRRASRERLCHPCSNRCRTDTSWSRPRGSGFTMPVMGRVAAGGVAVALLGSVEVGPAGGVMAPVAQPRLRVLVGLLGVTEGRVVTGEALVDGLWGGSGRRGGSGICTRWCISCGGGSPRWSRGKGGHGWPGPGPGPADAGPGELDVAVFWDVAVEAGRRRGPGTRPGRGNCWGRRWGCGGGRR